MEPVLDIRYKAVTVMVVVAQLVSALDCEPDDVGSIPTNHP